MLTALAGVKGVRHVRVASGVRHDLALEDVEFLEALAARFTGGQLKVAPEHGDPATLARMRKPAFGVFEAFAARFAEASRRAGKKQYLVPYLMSAFPGCGGEEMDALARWFADKGWRPRRAQCFLPTPGTVATAMYYAGVDEEGRPLKVARTDAERQALHRKLVQGGGRGKKEEDDEA
jgi:radical SAM superfamily enzyme YgiQ (UPF0313 family)